MSGGSRRRFWTWLVAVPLAAFLLYWSLRGVDWELVWKTLSGARWGLIAEAFGLVFLSFFLRALRWRILLNAEETLPVGEVFCATMAGYMGNAFLPARAGEMVRTLVVSGRSSLSKTYVLTTALSERLMDVIALVLWSSLVLLGVRQKPEWMGAVARTMAIIALLGAVAIAVLPHTGGLCQSLLRRVPLPPALSHRVSALADQVLRGMRAFHNPARFFGFSGFTVAIWISDALGVMAWTHSVGLAVSFSTAILLLTGLGLGSGLPSTPGYIGIYQFVAVTVLAPFGISKSSALAFILLMQTGGYAATLALGLPSLYILRARKRGKDGRPFKS
ncbi:MAG TPA: lysylphosphatidylglycerol synthase transmembrane domain-containing protein [Bryobacteraceae bacterium]|nr:lysylphosphatidylglycerol synthase transmembrane domain-containing protein [Bryobacteraceae bacterium]